MDQFKCNWVVLHSFKSAVVNAYIFHYWYCWFCKYVSVKVISAANLRMAKCLRQCYSCVFAILIHSAQEKKTSVLYPAPNIFPVLVAILQHVCAVQHKPNAAEVSSPTVPGLQALHKIIRNDSITVNLTNTTTRGRPQGSGLRLRRMLMLASLCECVCEWERQCG